MTDFVFEFKEDFSKYFKRQFFNLENGAPKGAIKAAKSVSLDWWRRAGTDETGAPVDTGTLRASLSAGVQGKVTRAGTPNSRSGENVFFKGTPNREFKRPALNEILIQVGANTEYAAAVHEGVAPAGGKQPRIAGRGKYIELNLRENMKKWMRSIARGAGKSLK